MTLVLTCITSRYVIQVSDRRLTWSTGPNSGRIADDSQNKAVVVCNRLAFAYSGLARIHGKSTDDWLGEVAARVHPYSPADVLTAVAVRATEAFAIVPLDKTTKRHAFVAAGWGELGEPTLPFIASVSNALDNNWRWKDTSAPTFRTRLLRLDPAREFLWTSTGAILPESERRRIDREIRACHDRNTGPAGYVRVLSDAIRRIATHNPSVGGGLLAVCMPLLALRESDGVVMLLGAPFSEDHLTSLFLPPGQDDGIQYGPHFVSGGSMVSRVRAEPIRNPEQRVEEPPWVRGSILLSERTGTGRSIDDAIRDKLSGDYKVAGCGVVAEAHRTAMEGGPLPCLLYIEPATTALDEIFADPRYFLVVRSADEAQERVDEKWLGDLLDWLRARGVNADLVAQDLAQLGINPTRAEVIVALRDSFRTHADLSSDRGAT